MASIVNYSEISDGLKKLPLCENPVILVHSSLKSFGYVEGGAQAVINALLDVSGKNGTIIMPVLTFNSINESDPSFDVNETPSDCGIITEIFRKMPGIARSLHVVSSAAAMGEKADYITCFHEDTPCGYGSPYQKIVELDGYCLFIGTGFKSNTIFHVAEEYVNPFYLKYKTIENVRVKRSNGITKECSFRRYDCWQTGIIRRLEKMGDIFEQEDVLTSVMIGDSVITLIRAAENFRLCCDVLEKNPGFILD